MITANNCDKPEKLSPPVIISSMCTFFSTSRYQYSCIEINLFNLNIVSLYTWFYANGETNIRIIKKDDSIVLEILVKDRNPLHIDSDCIIVNRSPFVNDFEVVSKDDFSKYYTPID